MENDPLGPPNIWNFPYVLSFFFKASLRFHPKLINLNYNTNPYLNHWVYNIRVGQNFLKGLSSGAYEKFLHTNCCKYKLCKIFFEFNFMVHGSLEPQKCKNLIFCNFLELTWNIAQNSLKNLVFHYFCILGTP